VPLRRAPAAKGSLFGSGDPLHDIPEMVELYRSGDLELDELITQTYTLDEVDQGYEDLVAGRNIRGVVLYDTPPLEGAPA
jgi:S-(hydroxymethyl)glutathione dehydrogenase/alcohol dehydrogenase